LTSPVSKKQPPGRETCNSLFRYTLPTNTAAARHVSSIVILAEPAGQALVLAGPRTYSPARRCASVHVRERCEYLAQCRSSAESVPHIYTCIHEPMYLFTHEHTPNTYAHIYLSIYLSIYLQIDLSMRTMHTYIHQVPLLAPQMHTPTCMRCLTVPWSTLQARAGADGSIGRGGSDR
jgi:hypothetical protein